MSDVNRVECGLIADKGGYVDFAFVDIGGFTFHKSVRTRELGDTSRFSGGML